MRNIIGWHDHSEHLNQSIPSGYCVVTEEIGCEPRSVNGKQYPQSGIQYIVRLNYSHSGNGTIPKSPNQYTSYAETCASFVSKSAGCTLWIIGNEPNLNVEGNIKPKDFAQCFNLCQAAIKRVQPNAVVMAGGIGPWNTQTTYEGNPAGDWVQYFIDLHGLINPDAICVHTYSDGHNPQSIAANIYMQAPFNHRRYGFRTYIDFMEAIPQRLCHLPVYITETNPNDAWIEGDKEWIRQAYAEINRWNQLGKQQIHALCLYRWVDHDKWSFCNKPYIHDALKEVSNKGYSPQPVKQPVIEPTKPEPVTVNTGRTVKILRKTKLRATPGYINKPEKDELMSLMPSDVAEVIGANQSADGLEWINVRVHSNNGSLLGWLAQSAPDKTAMVELVGGKLKLGDRVACATVLNVRSGAGRSSPTIQQLPAGTVLTIKDGPQFADGLVWWNLGIGWCAESVNGVDLLKPYNGGLIEELANQYGIELRVAKAVLSVESGEHGFGVNGKLMIRFEPHVFLDRLTDPRHREKFTSLFTVGVPAWNGEHHQFFDTYQWRTFHGDQILEYRAWNTARSLNEKAAFESISMGAAQIMGFNHADCGYQSAQDMFNAFQSSYDEQLKGFFRFLAHNRLIEKLRSRDFVGFAAGYNGPGQAGYYAQLIEGAIK